MKCKQLGLRVLSTAAIMSIVSSIAMPAFADIYYIGNGSIDIETKTSEDGIQYVEVTQRNADGSTTKYTDTSDEIVIKDGTSESDTTLKEANRIEGERADVAVADTDKTSTTSIGESAPVTQETKEEETPAVTGEAEQPEETAEEPEQEEQTPAEGEPEGETGEEAAEEPEAEQSAEKPEEETPAAEEEEQEQPEASAEEPAAEQDEPEQPKAEEQTEEQQEPQLATMEAQEADTPVAQDDTHAAGSTDNPTNNVIRIINDWAEKVLNIRLSNVNIAVDSQSKYGDGTQDTLFGRYHSTSALQVDGKEKDSKTKIELDGQNVLKSDHNLYWAALNKKGAGNLTITDETTDTGEEITAPKSETDTSGSLKAQGSVYGGAGIGGNRDEATDNITIEGYANVTANEDGSVGRTSGIGSGKSGKNITIQGNATVTSYGGAGYAAIGGGDAENITIQGNANVTAKSSGSSSAAIGGDNAKNIVIRDHATVNATTTGGGAAIGSSGSGSNTTTDITIGTEGATSKTEDVHVTAKSEYGAAIGGGDGQNQNTVTIVIQGNSTIESAVSEHRTAIGNSGNQNPGNVTNITIKDNATLKDIQSLEGGVAIGDLYNKNTTVNIESGKLENVSGAVSGIGASTLKIGNNVLLKLKQGRYNAKYIGDATNTEVPVGRSKTPNDGGLINTIGDNTEIWYTDSNNKLVQIVHGKDLCVWDEGTVTKEPTCHSTGVKTYHCIYEQNKGATEHSCDREKTEVIPATEHSWVNDGEHHDATCVSDGYQDQKCSNDGCDAIRRVWDNAEDETHAGDPNKHDYEDQEWVIDQEATCTEEGKKHQVCKNAPGEESHYNVEEIPATGHQHTEIRDAKEATCQEPGYTGDKWCTDCNTKLEDGHEIPKLDHVEEIKNAKEPSCTEDGYTGDKWCTKGDHLLEEGEVIPKLNHDYEEKVTKEPTCTEDGEKTFTCKRGDNSYTEKIPATGHQHTEVVGAKEPTCTEPGYTGDTVCKDCGEIVKKGEEIPATGHQHTHIEGAKDATETEDGYTGDTVCDDCGAVVSKGERIPAKGVPAEENTEKVSAPELWVIAPDTIRQTFTVSQSGTVRTYTSPYNSGTLTGTMEILQYLQEQGVETIVFTTNQRTSRFAVADLLALVNEGDVFYLQHMDANEPTLLVIANDHSDLLNG